MAAQGQSELILDSLRDRDPLESPDNGGSNPLLGSAAPGEPWDGDIPIWDDITGSNDPIEVFPSPFINPILP